MIIRRTKEFKLNLGNYESATISATIEVDTERDDLSRYDADEVATDLTERIDLWLAADVAKLSEVNAPLKEGQSVIDYWEDMNG